MVDANMASGDESKGGHLPFAMRIVLGSLKPPGQISRVRHLVPVHLLWCMRTACCLFPRFEARHTLREK